MSSSISPLKFSNALTRFQLLLLFDLCTANIVQTASAEDAEESAKGGGEGADEEVHIRDRHLGRNSSRWCLGVFK